jgi:hypothetical protein
VSRRQVDRSRRSFARTLEEKESADVAESIALSSHHSTAEVEKVNANGGFMPLILLGVSQFGPNIAAQPASSLQANLCPANSHSMQSRMDRLPRQDPEDLS